uniref:Reverse transcriptase zinc-binding domain-containing protein n=1 Tax=Fagus sylvatica TaxID=28930 RepID=A0A2N9GPL7_FAGSY
MKPKIISSYTVIWLEVFGLELTFFIRNLTEAEITVDNWIKDLLQHHNESSNNTSQRQLILTLMWSIWFHRNQIMFEGKQPNPMEIILTSKSLLNRFLQAPSNNAGNTEMGSITAQATSWQPDNNWQVLITTEGGAAKNGKWQGMPYVGKKQRWSCHFCWMQNHNNTRF